MIEKIKKFESKWYNKQKSNMLSFENKQISDIERNIKIIEAIWKKTLTFENECYGEIVTHIGDYWFYFWTGKDFADTITPENIINSNLNKKELRKWNTDNSDNMWKIKIKK